MKIKNSIIFNKFKILLFFFYIIDFVISKLLNLELSNISFIDSNTFLKSNSYISKNETNAEFNNNGALRILNETLIKCKTNDEIGIKNSLCIECNNELGYYPLIFNYDTNKNLEKYLKYKDCYNNDSVPNNYFFNSKLKAYEECYETCQTCFGHGDQTDNNCSSCKFNYIFKPETNYTKNCVKKCPYYYYYSLVGEYKCSDNFYCLEFPGFIIENKNKCIYDCRMDETYIYYYNGECLENCPENTIPNNLNKCLDVNTEICTLTIKKTKMIGILLKFIHINEMAKRYAEEFSYTNNHVSQFIADNYRILLYKNISCLSNMNLNSSNIDFDDCLKKIYYYYNISSPIIVIIDRLGKYNNPSSAYGFFDPITGEKIDTSFCQNTNLIIKKNISSIYKKEDYEFLVNQNVDIYNINDTFYSSPCFIFEKDNKDLILADRILLFYPNATLCEEGCEYNGTNYKTLITKCKCTFNETKYYLINMNLLEDEILKTMQDFAFVSYYQVIYLAEDLKVLFLVCYSNLFNFRYFIRNIGGLIILLLLIIEVINIILLIKNNSLNKISKFIMILIDIYIEYKKNKSKSKYHHKKKNLNNNLDSKNANKSKNNKNLIGSKNINKSEINKYLKNIENKSKEINTSLSNDNSKKVIETAILVEKNLNEKESKGQRKKKRHSSIVDINNHNYLDKIKNKDSFTEKDMKEYLSQTPDEMDFYEVLKKDKRPFCIFLINTIVKKQILVNTFYIVEETIPIYLKIILLTLYIDLYLFGVALYYSTLDISQYYHLNKKEYLKHHIKYFTTRLIISFGITTIVQNLMSLFFANKEELKSIIKREKHNEKNLKSEMIKLIRNIKIRYIIFIILNILYKIFSLFYISSFNNAYPNTKYIWIILSLVTIFISQIISVALAFLQACLRFIAIKVKIESIFKLSQYLNVFF